MLQPPTSNATATDEPRYLIGLYRRVRTVGPPLESARIEVAVKGLAPRMAAIALLVAIAGFTVDDLRVLRLPAYLVGMCLAFLVFVAGPLWIGRLVARRWAHEPLDEFKSRMGRRRRIGVLGLLGSLVILVGWLVVFSAGVPPWAR